MEIVIPNHDLFRLHALDKKTGGTERIQKKWFKLIMDNFPKY